MILSQSNLTVLLNALYDTGNTRILVEHPCADLGELIEFELSEPFESPVRFPTSLSKYDERRSTIHQRYGESAFKDLPDDSAFVRILAASGVLSIENKDEVERFVSRHGYPDLEAGHPPVVVGIDANVMAWRVGELLNMDPVTGELDDKGRAPTNGYALATGVKEELDWYYKQRQTESLVDAFGPEFRRLDGEPAGASREGRLGLYEYRRLVTTRTWDRVPSGTGDEAIIEGYCAWAENSRKQLILFSNDYGFVDGAIEEGLTAQHVDFPRSFPQQATATWDELGKLLYYLAVCFGVIRLPGITIYGVWNGKDGRHWQQEAVAVEFRSPKLEPRITKDMQLVRVF